MDMVLARRSASSGRRGVTLVEAAISAALIGVMLVATMNAVGGVFRTRLAARQHLHGEALARELMAEILQASYQDPQGGTNFGPESGETGATRANFDDVDDYDGFSESALQDKTGNAVANCTGWSRQVSIARVEPAAPLTSVLSETGLKLITVVAVAPTGAQTTLQALRSGAGALEYRPPMDQTYVTGVRGEVQLGSGGLATTGQSAVVNHAEDQ